MPSYLRMEYTFKKIEKTQWYFFHKRHRSPFFQQLWFTNISMRTPRWKFNSRTPWFGSFLDHVVLDTRYRAILRNRAFSYMKKHPRFLLDLASHCHKDYARALRVWKRSANRDISRVTNKALAHLIHTYVREMRVFNIYGPLPLLLEDYFEETLQKRYAQLFNEESAARNFSITVDPVQNGTVLEEKIALLKLACKKNITSQDIARHTAQYSFMANVGFFEKYYDDEFYRVRIKQMQKRIRIHRHQNCHPGH